MHRIMVAGIGTGVGKTVVSAILTRILHADYWKPIQCGAKDNSDTATMKVWLEAEGHTIFPPAYSFTTPASPHHAARLEGAAIKTNQVIPPKTRHPLIIEGVGGILVPLTSSTLSIDLFANWNCQWVVVVKHYLGSINHTLLTIEALKMRKIPVLGIIFNGKPYLDAETSILEKSQLPLLGRLLPEPRINKKIQQKYAEQWRQNFLT